VTSPSPPPPYNQVEVGSHVTFIRSFTDEQKAYLLRRAAAVVYTPSNEHFGIVPLECMAAFRPVLAVASGGPLESVKDGETGFLLQPTPEVSG
jgi:alpha-1,3/alpha-1,6-mannosyltransferase